MEPGRPLDSQAGGRNKTDSPRPSGAMTPVARMSAHPSTEWCQAMSSVWTADDRGMIAKIRVARVDFPLELRPSMARSAGRPDGHCGSKRAIRRWIGSTRHGPAADSSGCSRNIANLSVSAAFTEFRCGGSGAPLLA
jgi:hypothetical protein